MVKTKVFVENQKNNSKRRRRNRQKPSGPYKPIPTNMKVAIRGRTYQSGTGTAAPLFLQYGLVEFLGTGGNYIDTLFGLYKYAKVHHCTITLRLVNMGSEPLIIACAPLPANWHSGSPTLGEILDVPKCVRKTTGSNGGVDRVTLVNSAFAKDILGAEYQTARYQMDSTQAASASPIVSTEPAWQVAVSSFNASTAISFRLEVEIEWQADFYDLDSS